MGYQQILLQARNLLEAEIAELRQQLEHKEASLKRLRPSFREPHLAERTHIPDAKRSSLFFTPWYRTELGGVPAREVVEAFLQRRRDVNESTIRSTLYQVTHQAQSHASQSGDTIKHVKVRKQGPLYDVEEISPEKLTVHR